MPSSALLKKIQDFKNVLLISLSWGCEMIHEKYLQVKIYTAWFMKNIHRVKIYTESKFTRAQFHGVKIYTDTKTLRKTKCTELKYTVPSPHTS